MEMALTAILTILLQAAVVQDSAADCGTNAQAQALAVLILTHESQQRPELHCNELLAQIAAQRASDLVRRDDSKGPTPNQVLIDGGFRFASFYPPIGNQVEAVARDLETAEGALDYMLRGYHHRDHVLGNGEFFSRQTEMGVGFHQDENGRTQWVVLIAEPYSSPRIVIKPEFGEPETITVDECPRTWRSSRNEELRKVCRERWLKSRSGGE
ncbi:MAG: hypothetical protein HKN15_13415 [Xanthomonadales bacterium]|nr:hypothetical protein [Xanthomonadales bacterium]